MEIKAAVIIGHPGHELRAYKFMKDYKPDVFILTDGSGGKNQSRLNQSIKVLETLGCNYKSLFTPFTDKYIYKIILENKIEELLILKQVLKKEIVKNKYNFILGDALEGFNPTHDLCRYLINSIIKEVSIENGETKIENYDFLLDAAPDKIAERVGEKTLSLKLTNEELEMKYTAAINYPELKEEVDMVIEKFGKNAFLWEFFRKVDDLNQLSSWDTPFANYEMFGRERVKAGLYAKAITFDESVKPIALKLLNL